MIKKLYSKYHKIISKRESKRLKQKGDNFSFLFQPKKAFSFTEFADTIESMGVKNSDNILIRLSSQLTPYIEGGLLSFYKSLFDYVDSGKGNVLSLSYSFDRSPLMYLSKDPVFSTENTATTVGICNELFRRMEGTSRSIHPTHSVSVYGHDRHEITASHHLDPHTYSEKSPFSYLYKHGCGKEIIIGLNHSSVGQHFIENKTKITGTIKNPILCRLEIKDEIKALPFYVDNPFIKDLSLYHTKDFISFLKKSGVLQQKNLHGISIYVYDSKKFYDQMEEVYNSSKKPYKRYHLKTFILNKIAKPFVVNNFFETQNGYLSPRKN